jgi:hypothetical protein
MLQATPITQYISRPGVQTSLLLAIVALGGLARFWNLGWDRGAYTFHPDEWALNEAVRNLGSDLHPHFFFYGSLPIYLYRGIAEGLSAVTGLDWLEPVRLVLVGRGLSALFSTVTLLLLFLVGRRLWGAGGGLLAAAFGAGAALAVQAAHFGTVESLLAMEGAAILLLSLHIADGAGRGTYALAGVVWGLAVATKLTAASFLVMPLVGHVVRTADGGRSAEDDGFVGRVLGSRPVIFVGCAVAAVLAAAPYYVLAWEEVWAAIREQSAELSGAERFAYVWQFEGNTPYVFELYNLVVWGLGVPLGVMALAGWGVLIADCGVRVADWIRPKPAARSSQSARRPLLLLLLLLWPTLYFLYIGTWEARFVRHLVPLVPFLCLFAVYALVRLWESGAWGRRAARVVGGIVVVGTAVWAVSFMAVYGAGDTRWQATEWIRANAAPGSRIVVEDKNDLVPVPDETYPPGGYGYEVVKVTEQDTPAKMEAFARALADGDWLVVSNRRWSGVLPRLERFPLTGRYYGLLFGGELGYREVATFASPPRLGPLVWSDDGAEETFQVFDHPTVRVFWNEVRLSEGELRRLLSGER